MKAPPPSMLIDYWFLSKSFLHITNAFSKFMDEFLSKVHKTTQQDMSYDIQGCCLIASELWGYRVTRHVT